jgi:hypothetical protein
MRRIAGREAAARAAAARHRERVGQDPPKDARQAADEEFNLGLSRFIESQLGYLPKISKMRTRDLHHWCALYYEYRAERARPITPYETPTYGKMWRYLHEGEPW